MNGATLTRSRGRLAHLAMAAVTIGAVYSPAFDAEALRELLRIIVVPGLALTGSVLWYLRGRRRRPPVAPPRSPAQDAQALAE